MKSYETYVAAFKALSDITRVKIVEMLSCGELCACEILESFQITQPTLSYHMKILTDSGLIQSRKEGAWMHYTLNEKMAEDIKQFLNQITTEQDNCICKDEKQKF